MDRLIGLAERVREWADLQKRFADSRNRWEQAERAGRRDGHRKGRGPAARLSDVLPRLQVIAEQRIEVHKADEKTKQLTKERKNTSMN